MKRIGLLWILLCLPGTVLAKNLDKKLLKAVLKGDLEQVEKFIAEGADVNYTTSSNESLLMCASERGYYDISELLIDHGANLDHRTTKGHDALSKASSLGRLQVAQLLLDKGYQAKSGGKTFPLWEAVQRRDFSIMRLLVDHGVDLNQQNNAGYTALHLAVQFGNPAFSELLLAASAEVNVQDKKGNTPLTYSVLENNLLTSQRLLQHGADPNVKNKAGKSPLMLVESWNQPLLKALNHPASIQMAPIQAKPKINLKTISSFVEKGMEVNRRGPNGNTPIYHIIEGGTFEALDYLIEKGGKVKTANDEGVTPLMVAVFHGRVTMVNLLLAQGADPNAMSNLGFGPLYLAGIREDKFLAKKLIAHGAYQVATLFNQAIELPEKKESYRRLKNQVRWLPNLTQASFSVHRFATKKEDLPPGIYTLEEPGISKPVFLQKVAPKYPRDAVKAKVQGYVVVEATLGKNGKARDFTVLRALAKGKYGFEVAAIESVKQWKFKPGTKEGSPVDVRMVLKIDFVLR